MGTPGGWGAVPALIEFTPEMGESGRLAKGAEKRPLGLPLPLRETGLKLLQVPAPRGGDRIYLNPKLMQTPPGGWLLSSWTSKLTSVALPYAAQSLRP